MRDTRVRYFSGAVVPELSEDRMKAERKWRRSAECKRLRNRAVLHMALLGWRPVKSWPSAGEGDVAAFGSVCEVFLETHHGEDELIRYTPDLMAVGHGGAPWGFASFLRDGVEPEERVIWGVTHGEVQVDGGLTHDVNKINGAVIMSLPRDKGEMLRSLIAWSDMMGK